MLYSKSQSSEKFDLFGLFITQYLRGHDTYKAIIDKVIKDTHLLSRNQKTIFEIDKDKFQIIVHLKNSDTRYFQHIDPDHLEGSDYKRVSELLRHKEEMNA